MPADSAPPPPAQATKSAHARANARAALRARFDASIDVPSAFFAAEADRMVAVSRLLASAFDQGHRLLVFGTGAQASDALHVAVEFVHPVIVGKRALPALALQAQGTAEVTALTEPGDVVLVLASGSDESARAALRAARSRGARTVALVGADAVDWPADHVFAVPVTDPFVVQETHETLYHVLWELVHVFLEREGRR